MSAYITLMTPMTDRECLLAALVDQGFTHAQIEVHAEPVALIGYGVAPTANVVIRRRHLGAAASDIGFLATATGYRAHVTDDHPQYGATWLRQLHERYLHHGAVKQARLVEAERRRQEEERRQLVEAQRVQVLAKAKQLGYQVNETREGDTVRLTLLKRTY